MSKQLAIKHKGSDSKALVVKHRLSDIGTKHKVAESKVTGKHVKTREVRQKHCEKIEIIDEDDYDEVTTEITEHEQYDMNTIIGGVSLSVSHTKTIKYKKAIQNTCSIIIKIGF
jgi:hypothetical protein